MLALLKTGEGKRHSLLSEFLSVRMLTWSQLLVTLCVASCCCHLFFSGGCEHQYCWRCCTPPANVHANDESALRLQMLDLFAVTDSQSYPLLHSNACVAHLPGYKGDLSGQHRTACILLQRTHLQTVCPWASGQTFAQMCMRHG